MDMVRTDHTFNDLYLLILTEFTKYFPDIPLQVSVCYFPPILRNPYDMIFAFPRCVG